MAPAVLHIHFKGNVKPEIEKNLPNINSEVIMKDKMAQKHTQNIQRKCATPTEFFKDYGEL